MNHDPTELRLNPLAIIQAALPRNPLARLALTIAAIGAVAAILRSLFGNLLVALAGTMAIMLGMVLLIVIEKIRGHASREAAWPPLRVCAAVLVYFVTAYLIAASILLFSSVFFGVPLKLQGSSIEKSDPRSRLAISNWVGYAPFYLAAEAGLLPNWNLVYNQPVSREQRRNFIVKERIDAYVGTIDETIIDLERQAQYSVRPTAVLLLSQSCGGDAVISREKLSTAQDLIGKRVGVWSGGTAYFLLTYWLSTNGVHLDQIRLTHVETAQDLVTGFANKKYDAIATWSPWIQKAAKSGYVIHSTSGCAPPFIVDALFLSDTSPVNAARVRELFSAWDRGVELLRHLGSSDRLQLCTWLGLSGEDADHALGGVKFLTTKDDFGDLTWEELVDAVGKQARQAGLVMSGQDSNLTINRHFLSAYRAGTLGAL